MSIVNISELSPRVREAFMLTEPAINAWDVNAHKILEDSIQNGMRIYEDITCYRVIYEIICGLIVAVIFDIFPGMILYVERHDPSIIKVKWFCILFMFVSNILVALHRKRKLFILKQQGAEWRDNINQLIEVTTTLSWDERQQLYAMMFTLGLEVQQGKRNAAMIRAAYDEGWSDGFSVGGNQ